MARTQPTPAGVRFPDCARQAGCFSAGPTAAHVGLATTGCPSTVAVRGDQCERGAPRRRSHPVTGEERRCPGPTPAETQQWLAL